MARPSALIPVAVLAAAAIGLTLFLRWSMDPEETASAVETTQALAVTTSNATASTVPAVAETTGPLVEGLPPAVARVLADAGHLERLSAGEVGLPPAVTRVLADHGVVLSVNEGVLTHERPVPGQGPASISEGVMSQ
jgi:hypothetical protein